MKQLLLTFIFATWTSFLSLSLSLIIKCTTSLFTSEHFPPLSKSSKSLVNTARWEIIDMELKIHNVFEGDAVKGLLKIACSDLCLYTFEVIYLDHIGWCTAGNTSAQLSQYWVFCSGLLGHIKTHKSFATLLSYIPVYFSVQWKSAVAENKA